MNPSEIYATIKKRHPDVEETSLCNLHSACSPRSGKSYMCRIAGSRHPALDFDKVKDEFVKCAGLPSCSSVDALAVTPSGHSLCFAELKSWEMVNIYNRDEEKKSRIIQKQASKYKSDIPKKLVDSITICEQTIEGSLQGIDLHLILVTDINTSVNSSATLANNLNMLAGTAVKKIDDWRELCNTLSQNILNGITGITTHYWHCTEFDSKIATL